MLPNYNVKCVVFIPKILNNDSVNHYRPTAIANFKYKIISKTIVDRLANVFPSIISIEKIWFIKGRQIKECICLTTEAINLLYKKYHCGNLALKVDLYEAFDTFY